MKRTFIEILEGQRILDGMGGLLQTGPLPL
jgi:hypothetical protein